MAYTELFTERIELMRPETVVNPKSGARRTVFTPTQKIWAERVRVSASTQQVIGEDFPEYRIDFRTHIFYTCEEHWRLTYEGRVYEVKNVIRDRRNGLKLLKCNRVNP